jgi:hypothetical protein
MRKWQDWAPKTKKFRVSQDSEPTKPTKLGYVGFVGPASRGIQNSFATKTTSTAVRADGGGLPRAKSPTVPADIPATAPSLSACGQPHCAGCYEVEPGRRIHPPRPSQEWLDWVARWQKPKGEHVQ